MNHKEFLTKIALNVTIEKKTLLRVSKTFRLTVFILVISR